MSARVCGCGWVGDVVVHGVDQQWVTGWRSGAPIVERGTFLIPWQFLRVHSRRLLGILTPVPAFPPMGTHNSASLCLYVVSNRAGWLVCSGTCLYFWRQRLRRMGL